MTKIFIPLQNKKKKTAIRGFWQNESGKIFYDYINQDSIALEKPFLLSHIEALQKEYKQEAIFYIQDNTANIFYSADKIEVLKNRVIISCTKKLLKANIKYFLKKYSGCTVYINRFSKGTAYTIEAWTI